VGSSLEVSQLYQLFEKRIGPVEHTTKYRRLYHLTDNYGLGITVETNTLRSLRQDYISTTYRRETNSILGRQAYYYKLILNAKKLAKNYGVFPYDHQINIIGSGEKVSADEAEIGIETKKIDNIQDYLVGVVILTKPYTEHQILFLADINKNVRGGFDVEKTGTIHAVTALNQLTVPLYWQQGIDFIPLTEKDHQYLRDIEKFLDVIENNKTRQQRQLDLLELLLDKYDIKSDDLIRGKESLDKQIIYRRRLIPKMMSEINSYFTSRYIQEIDPNYLKNMLIHFMKMMKFGNNTIAVVIGAAEKFNFFHPTVAPVAWTGVLKDLVDGQIEAAIETIEDEKPDPFKIKNFENPKEYGMRQRHVGSSMMGDDE